MPDMPAFDPAFPAILPVGLSGLLVRFAETLTEPANRAALALRAAVDRAGWAGIEETATSLTGTFLRLDPLLPDADLVRLMDGLRALVGSQDWYAAPLPQGRRLFEVPVVIGGPQGPQWDSAAQASGLAPDAALDSLLGAQVRVLTIGFAPGQPYMGQLPPAWDIPRLAKLTPQVPAGALVLAIRQIIIFSNDTPTGWHHIGQSAFRLFRPGTNRPFALSPGDELRLRAVTPEALERIRATDQTGDGGATIRGLP